MKQHLDTEDFMRSKFLCAAGFVAVAGVGQAMAADLPARPYAQPAPVAAPAYVPEWAGFYFGFHAGGGWDHSDFNSPVPGLLGALFDPALAGISIPNSSGSGAVFGGHAGYNWQYGGVVGGVEVDYSGADIKETTPAIVGVDTTPVAVSKEVKLDQLASVRGRLGYAVLPNLLLYGTAGVGWGHTKVSVTATGVPPVDLGGTGLPSVIGLSTNLNQFGWVAGAGVEWKVWQHILLRAEYLHYDFADNNVLPALIEIKEHVDVVRGGISYKF